MTAVASDAHLWKVAALLERAYRLALVVNDGPPSDRDLCRFVTAELVEVLDETRVALFAASKVTPPPMDL